VGSCLIPIGFPRPVTGRLIKPLIKRETVSESLGNCSTDISNPLNRDLKLTSVSLRTTDGSPGSHFFIYLVSPDAKNLVFLDDGVVISRSNSAIAFWHGNAFWHRDWKLHVAITDVPTGVDMYITYTVEEWP